VSYFKGRIPSRCSHDRFSARASASLRPVGYINSRCDSRFPCISVTHLHQEWASVYFSPLECSTCLTSMVLSRAKPLGLKLSVAPSCLAWYCSCKLASSGHMSLVGRPSRVVWSTITNLTDNLDNRHTIKGTRSSSHVAACSIR
jgi:hypothetical protein